MKKTIYTLSLISLITWGCTKDFDKINKNPNGPENISPQFLLSNIIWEVADRNTYDQGFILASYLVQQSASVEFERIDRYEMGSNSEYWDALYRLLADIQSMKEVEGTNEAYAAVGDIMSCFIYSQLTDMWADVPYTEATQAKTGNFTPKYDSQEEIYTNPQTGLIAVLKNAADVLANTNSPISGDIMFNNDLGQWTRFANSLRVRYLMRMSKRFAQYPALQSELQSIVDGGKIMLGNPDNAVVPYLASAPNQFPLFNASQGGYQEHRMTQTADSILTLWDDPRVAVLYKPTQKSVTDGNPEYKGLLNGQSRETIASQNIDLNDISLYGAIFRDQPDGVDAQIMQYAELQFALAEAAEKGFISGSAQAYYQAGVEASFEYYDVEVPADYFSRASVMLDGTNNLNRILTQKWLALFNCGHEAWFSVRRTGIPNLKPGPDNLNGGKYPVRYFYPESEQATNSKNYQNAIQEIGGDNINSKGWWEK